MDGAQTVDSGQQTPPLPPNTNHHRHPTMTQPCHKDTHPNQQCCDSKNNEGRDKAKKGKQDNTRRQTQCEHGDTTPRTPPPFNKGRQANNKGDANTEQGGTPTLDGEVSNTATLPPPCHPTTHDGPTHHHEWGGSSEDTPPREDLGQTLTHTPHDLAENSARRDRSTHTVCTGSRWHRPHHRTRETSSITHHRHSTHHRRDGHHPLTSSHTVHIHTPMNNHDQRRSTIIVQ